MTEIIAFNDSDIPTSMKVDEQEYEKHSDYWIKFAKAGIQVLVVRGEKTVFVLGSGPVKFALFEADDA